MEKVQRRYFAKYTDGDVERFELFWASSDFAAKKEAELRTLRLPLVEVHRCVCITPRVKEVEQITHRMEFKKGC